MLHNLLKVISVIYSEENKYAQKKKSDNDWPEVVEFSQIKRKQTGL